MNYPCRQCNKLKPEDEVISRFTVYGKKRIRFRQCKECMRLAKKAYRNKKEDTHGTV